MRMSKTQPHAYLIEAVPAPDLQGAETRHQPNQASSRTVASIWRLHFAHVLLFLQVSVVHVIALSASRPVHRRLYGTLATRPANPPVLVQDIPFWFVLV